MAGTKREEVREEDITGLEYFDKLKPILQRLHDVGCERDRAGNRQLHMDQYCMLVLLFLFNPVVRSLRAIQQAGELKKVQKKLGCRRASLGSLSESVAVFDPERLQEIIAELGQQLQPIVRDPRLKNLQQVLTLADGTLLRGLPHVVQAALADPLAEPLGDKWRLHTQFEVERYVPTRMTLTEGLNSGDADERAVLAQNLEACRFYTMDRGFVKAGLFNDIVDADSSYVCRQRDDCQWEIVEERTLEPEDKEAGVILDARVRVKEAARPEAQLNHAARVVILRSTPHHKRGKTRSGSTGPACDGFLVLATNRLDLPAWVIALIYRYRWTIETFFRFFKHILGCRHVLSENAAGIKIQTYCAIIACMLISLWTGRKPSLRTYEMICHYFTGLADEEELLQHLAKLPKHPATTVR